MPPSVARLRRCRAIVFAGCCITGCTVPSGGSRNGNVMMNDNAAGNANASAVIIEADASTRLPFASRCSQFATLCTASFPTAVISVIAGAGQSVASTDAPIGFTVTGSDRDGVETVMFRGRESDPGAGASSLLYSWSSGATDADPCTQAAGPEFSTDADPVVAMRAGRHIIRLTVRNTNPLASDVLPGDVIAACGTLPESFAFDMLELVVEVRD